MSERAPFSRDEPVPLSNDAFGHLDYTEALVSIVTDERPPPTVGVFGPWGVGKSTIIGGVQDRLVGGEIAFVYFDAWRYEGDSLRRQLLMDAAHQLKNDGRLGAFYNPEEELRELHVERQEASESLAFSRTRMKHGLIALLIFVVLGLVLYFTGVIDAVLSGEFGTAVLASVTAFAVGTFATILTQTVVIAPTTTTTRALQDPDRFAAKFADLLGALNPPRLVVAIDNLDRCSPESAIQMLSTIKTYLEPAVAGASRPSSSAVKTVDKQVVFVVSVDDQALRRHLIAKEAERSRDEDSLAVRRYVDEYLAKFFSARLPIRAILPDDMRGYITHHLQPLIKARVPDKDHARELVNLVGAGLRRNPRRVKQFHNDLESRLRLLEERESTADGRSAGIDPPLSGDVRGIAKLALIESEWPEAFERLERNPPLLAKWEQLTETDDEVDWVDREILIEDEAEIARGRQARRDFATFLSQARSIKTPHLRAMISLKQSPDEAGLPGFTEFRAAVTSGDRAEVEEILAAAPAERERLIARLPQIMGEEVSAGDLPAARAVIDVAVSLEPLQPFSDLRGEILRRAATSPRLRRELGLLNPEAVLSAADLVTASDRHHLFQPYIDRMLSDELGDGPRRSAADALAPLAAQMTPEQRAQISSALRAEPLQGKFAIYRRFAEEAPDLIPAEAVEAALTQAEAPASGEEQPSLAAHPEALAVADATLPQSSAELQRRAIQLVLAAVRSHTAPPALAAELERGESLLAELSDAGAEHWTQLIEELAASWGAYTAEDHGRLISFFGRFLPRAGADTQQQVPVNVLNLLFEAPEHALAVIGELDPLPDSFLAATLERLVAHAADPAQTEATVPVLTRLAGDAAAEHVGRVFTALCAAGHLEPAAALLESADALLRQQLPTLAEGAVPHLIERVNSGQPLPAAFFDNLAAAMSDGALNSLAETIAARLRDGAPENVSGLLEVLRQRPESVLCDRVAAQALDLLVGLEAFTPELAPLLGAVCADVSRLDADRQRRLADKLAAWLHAHPGQLSVLAEKMITIEGLAAEPARVVVEGILDIERSTDDPAIRRQLLEAAFHLKGRQNSKATAAVRKHIGELELGTEIDREIASEFAGRLASSRD